MPPVLLVRQAVQELLCCAGWGLLAGAVRALFPPRGRRAFWPDLLLVIVLLLLLQGYAAQDSFAGVLRWYMAAGAFAGASAAAQLAAPLTALLYRGTRKRRPRRRARPKGKETPRGNQKYSENSLPKQQALLYNSNI